ncbi:group 1 glycosyl transferase [Salinisphaera shabanensis T35B1]
MTKVMFLFAGSDRLRYGVAEVFRHVLNGLDKSKYQPYLIITGALTESDNNLVDAVEVIELGRKGLRKAFLPFVHVLRAIRPDIVVSAMEHPNALAVLARVVSRHKCKLILTSHNVLTPRLEHMWSPRQARTIRFAVRSTYTRSDHIVFVSDAVRRDFQHYVPRMPESSVIYNPVLKGDRLPAACSNKTKGLIVASSRLEFFKRTDEAISALQFLDQHYHLLVLGDGPERARLEALTAALGLNDRVEFAGYVSDPFAYYRLAEIFVLPSQWEGFGNVLIESMACGCQVVANADAWAPAEVLGHGEYGFLYHGGDAEDLARSIGQASATPKPVDKLVSYASRFTDERAAREYEQVFESLLGTT